MPNRGLGITFYGTEGIGKTSFAMRFPKPVSFISIRESGYEDFKSLEEVPEGVCGFTFEEYQPLYNYILGCDDATIVIDSLSGFQQILYRHIITRDYQGNENKFFAFQSGPTYDAPAEMVKFEALLNVKRNQGRHVVLLGHAKVNKQVNPGGADFLTYTLDLDKGLLSCFLKWSQATIFMNQEVNINLVTEQAKGGMVLEGKASDSAVRLMYTRKAMTHSAKNRLNLPIVIPMGDTPDQAFNNFWDKVPPAFK